MAALFGLFIAELIEPLRAAETLQPDFLAEDPGREMPDILIREIDLAEVGKPAGISFSRLSGSNELFFPAPDAKVVEDATLILNLRQTETLPSDRFLEVRGGNQIVATLDVSALQQMARIELPVEPRLIENGFLRLSFLYSGAVTDRMCVDERSSGDSLVIDASSHLRLALVSSLLDRPSIIRMLQPQAVEIATESLSDPLQMAAALRAGVLFGAQNGLVRFAPETPEDGSDWTRARISLGTGEEATLAARVAGHRPGLHFAGRDPQSALSAIDGAWFAVANRSPLGISNDAIGFGQSDHLSFAELGFDLRPKTSAGSVVFDFGFEIDDIPAGQKVGSVSLLLAAAPTPDGTGTTAVAFLNDTIIGSGEIPNGSPHWFDFDLPEGLIARRNLLKVQILRQRQGGHCTVAAQEYPSQVLPGSRFNLEDRSAEISSFFELRQAMQSGIDLFISEGLAEKGLSTLTWLAPIIATIAPPEATIRPVQTVSSAQDASAFVVVSEEPPTGSNPRLRFSENRIELRSVRDDLILDSSELKQLSVVQIVSIGDRTGLWIKPGRGVPMSLTPQNTLLLDHGDLALLDETGVVVVASTLRSDVLRVTYPDQRSIGEILNRYRPWIIGGLWVILTIFILQVLTRFYRARRT